MEAGTFEEIAGGEDSAGLELDATELAMLLAGVSIASARRRKRYRRAS